MDSHFEFFIPCATLLPSNGMSRKESRDRNA